MNLFFHLFEVNSFSKGQGYGRVSLHPLKNEIFRVYIDIWKIFKEKYFLVTSLSPLTHNELCVVPSSSSNLVTYFERRMQFWSGYHFSRKAKDYSILYDTLIDLGKATKETSLSFSETEIHCHVITEAKYVDERKKLLLPVAYFSLLQIILRRKILWLFGLHNMTGLP